MTIELREIGEPIPMYMRILRTDIPAVEEEVGFDLIVSDWVRPYGKGDVSDMIFLLGRRVVDRLDYEGELTVSFSNEGDGLISFPASAHRGSELRIPAIAPEEGYQPVLHAYNRREPGKFVENSFEDDMNYYLRVRTELDEDGNVRRAHYGKIYGEIVFSPWESETGAFLKFHYYLNSTPNSRNVEYARRKNLLTGLGVLEEAHAP